MAVEAEWLLTFLAGLTIVLAAAHTLGTVADRLGFAAVVGELLTGLVLGPSLLGLIAPSVTALVAPVPERLAALGLAIGILTPAIYAAIGIVAIVTSVMTPPLLRRALAHLPDSGMSGSA